MIASPSNTAEKDHPDNLSLAGDGFDTVIKAKAAVDADPKCRNKVSCADILALATRDAIVLVKKKKNSDSDLLSLFSIFTTPVRGRGILIITNYIFL